MRRRGRGAGFWLSVLVLVTGCTTANMDLRPPKQPEQLVVPPESEARFSQPPYYDDKILNQEMQKRSQPQGLQPAGPPGSSGMGGGGMGGMGGGGMGGMGGGGMGGMGGGMGR